MTKKPVAKKSAPAPIIPTKVAVPAPEAQIIPDGDYAGMTYDEVMRLTSDALDDAYASLSLQGVCAVHDMKMGEILEIVREFEGPAQAHEAALRFGQTLMPYLTTATPKIKQRAYGDLIGHNRGPSFDDED